MDTHFSKLPNSLIEICVVVGMDQDTGLVPARSAEQSKKATKSGKQESPLSETLFETHVLAALSGEVASFCCKAVEFDSEPYYSNLGILCSPTKGGNPGRRARRGSVRVKTAELPLAQEVINSLPQFCFPDGGSISKKKKPVDCHSLVLTDMEGNRTYCSCMTFYRRFLIKEDTDLPGNCKLFYADEKSDGQVMQDSFHQLYYVPTCCCLISKWPYFNIMKDCMSSLLPQVITSDPALFRTALMQFVSQLAMVPVPPPGSLGIEFELLGVKHLLRPAETPEHRVVNMDLHYLFLYFSLDDILLLMSCILTQQRIVFLSSSYSLLTPVIESLFTFIQPFSWSWTYVPILPSALLDLVEAPGAFIMGCHRGHKSKIERVVMDMDEFSTFVIADIDEGSVSSPPRIQRLPTYAAELYKFRMKNAVIHFDSLLLQRQTFYSLQEWKECRDQFVRDFQQLVLASNLEMMLRMFSDIKNFIVRQKDLFFDMDAYIESKPLDNQGFFREVCRSHAFSMFLYDLIHNPEKTDYFTLMAQKIRVVPKVGPLRKRSSAALTAVPVIPDQCFFNSQEELSIFALPLFAHGGIHTGRFYEDYLKSLNSKITDPTNNSSSLLANHLYLRGMLRIARRENTKAVDDFFGVSSRSAQLFPTSTVKEIMCKLSDSEVEELRTRNFWRKAERLRIHFKEKWNYLRERKEVVTSAIPSTPLAFDEFMKHVGMLQIANDQDAGRRLFQALTNDSMSTVVDPETFATFYYAFTEASIKAKSLSLRNIVLERNEYILKVSKHIKTNKGMGWLVLSVDRLLFLPDGTQNCRSVLRNDEIENVEPHSESRLSLGDTAIRITSIRDSVSFIASVKEEKDFWRSCLLEMKAAYKISDIYKDKQIVKQAAQNVIMADSLSQSNYPDQVAMQVLYYSTQSDHKSKLTKTTEKALFMRVNPSPQDIEKSTVEALLYVPGSKERERKIWCAMGSGLVVVIDTKDWEYEMHMKHAKDRVSCLLAVGENQVWAGSLDTTIYVINTQTGKADQQLLGHHDLLSCMIQTKDSQGQTTVWSAGLNGQIVGWDPVTLTAKKELQVKLDQRNGKTLSSIAEVGDTFWCATRFNVVVINYNGDDNETKTLIPKEGDLMSVDTMCAVSEKEVWTGCDKKGLVVIWNTETYKNKHHTVCQCNGFTCMLKVDNMVWAGSKSGNIYVIEVKQLKVTMELSLHQDRVRSMCLTDEGFVISGPGSRDGRIAVWKSHLFEDCPGEQRSSYQRPKCSQQIIEEVSTCGEEEDGFEFVCKKKTVKVDGVATKSVANHHVRSTTDKKKKSTR